MENAKQAWDSVHDTQLIYRALLDAATRPGTVKQTAPAIHKLTLPGKCSRAAAGIAHALLDGEVRFAVHLEGQEELAPYVRRMTFSREASLTEADYLFADGLMPEETIGELMSALKRGTLEAPDESATLFIRVQGMGTMDMARDRSEGEDEPMELTLSGPGIRDEQVCVLNGISPEWLMLRESLNAEYPMGVDMYFYTEEGELLALPRTTQVRKEEPAWHM